VVEQMKLFKGILHLCKDGCVLKWVIYVEEITFEFGATEKSQKMYFWLMWMKDNNSQNALASLP